MAVRVCTRLVLFRPHVFLPLRQGWQAKPKPGFQELYKEPVIPQMIGLPCPEVPVTFSALPKSAAGS